MSGDGGSAFPIMDDVDGRMNLREPGMTLRDYFAAKVMNGMISCQDFMNELSRLHSSKESAREHLAFLAYSAADAMLKEREKFNG